MASRDRAGVSQTPNLCPLQLMYGSPAPTLDLCRRLLLGHRDEAGLVQSFQGQFRRFRSDLASQLDSRRRLQYPPAHELEEWAGGVNLLVHCCCCFLDRLHDPLCVNGDNQLAEADVIREGPVLGECVEPQVAPEGQVRFASGRG